MKDLRTTSLFVVSAIAGVLIWMLWAVTTGGHEPWDSPYGYFVVFVSGFIFGLLGEQKPLLWPTGIFLGQFLYGLAAFLKDMFFYSGGGVNFFFPLGMILLMPFCVPAFIGSLIGAAVRRHGRGT